MNKYILCDMVTEKLKKEIGMVAKPFPEELKVLEGEVPPFGKVSFESSLYQAEKLKKISFSKHMMGGEAFVGCVAMIVAEDEYDLPFIVTDISLVKQETDKIFAELEAKPLVKDEESLREYIEPFREWREAMGELPSEPVTGFGEPGEFLKNNLSPIHYLSFIPTEYSEEVLRLTEQFFDIFVNIYRKANPVTDAQRRQKMDAFRTEYNRYVLDEDPSGVALINAFGREKAKLFYQHLVDL